MFFISSSFFTQAYFLFILSYNFNWIACVTSFFTLFFFVHSPYYVFGYTWLTSLLKLTSSLWNWLFFRGKSKRWSKISACHSNWRVFEQQLVKQILNQNITSQHFKKVFFWSVPSYLYEASVLRSYCVYFLAICQLCFFMLYELSERYMRVHCTGKNHERPPPCKADNYGI